MMYMQRNKSLDYGEIRDLTNKYVDGKVGVYTGQLKIEGRCTD